ncbi:MAG TPA: hypothetical protein EYP16_04480 [Candidatus Atribacteria bacterium]|nr:hypothetical protein [Candidatus Atribacteria bacterium]
MTQRNYVSARLNYSKVLNVDPGNKVALNKLQQIKKMTSKDIESLNLKAILAYTEGNLELAIKLWEQVLKMEPDNKRAKKNIQRAKEKLKLRGYAL